MMSSKNENRIEYTRYGKLITPQDKALDKITCGVAVITTHWNEKPYGMTAAWFTRSSNEPYLMTVSVWNENFTHDILLESKIFATNILSENQRELVIHFGRQSGRDIDKFADVRYRPEKSGSPILYQDAIAYMDCRTVNNMKAGDHTIFLGEILQAAILSDQVPLIYDRQDYP
jgi:flavin reductase (DIM6/NTAB) family NADH-FMN oxidoreductase RutF